MVLFILPVFNAVENLKVSNKVLNELRFSVAIRKNNERFRKAFEQTYPSKTKTEKNKDSFRVN